MLFKKLVVPMCQDYYIKNCSKLVFYKTDIKEIILKEDHLCVILYDDQNYNIPISAPKIMFEGIRIESHIGTWYSIDHMVYGNNIYFLLEHEEYGDETSNIIIDIEGNVILDNVFNGFADLDDYFESQKEQSIPTNSDNIINIVVQNGLIEAVYASDKNLNVSIIDLDTTNLSLKKYLIDEIKNLKIDKYDIL